MYMHDRIQLVTYRYFLPVVEAEKYLIWQEVCFTSVNRHFLSC